MRTYVQPLGINFSVGHGLGSRGAGSTSGIRLSNATFNVGSAQGSAIGTLSVVGGTGTYTFTLTDNASNKAQVAGTNGVNLQVGSAAASVGSFAVTVNANNGAGSVFNQTFLLTALAVSPVNTVLPVISGTPQVGSTLSVTQGTWTGTAPITYTYQWKRGGVDIGGATANTYALVVGDIGTSISAAVTGTNGGGSATVTAAAVGPITGVAPANTVVPVITGGATMGSVLTTTDGTWTGTPAPTFTYQWKRNGVAIGGATANTYTTVVGDLTTTITVTVTGTNVAGNAAATSAGVGPITGTPTGATPTYYFLGF